MLNMCREREEGKDTTKKMLNIQVEGKRRRGGYHQEDVKHTSAEREEGEDTTKNMLNMREREEGRIPPRRC